MDDMPEIKLDDLGLTSADLDFEFGDTGVFESLYARENTAAEPIVRNAEEIAAHRKEMRTLRTEQEHKGDMAPETDGDYYLMVVFESRNAKEQWLKENRFPDGARFVSYAEFSAASMGLVGDQGGVIQQAIDRVRESENAPEMKASRCIELLSADWLAGALAGVN